MMARDLVEKDSFAFQAMVPLDMKLGEQQQQQLSKALEAVKTGNWD
jgi:hypothetical protein